MKRILFFVVIAFPIYSQNVYEIPYEFLDDYFIIPDFNSLEQIDNFLSLKEIAERREANKNKTKTI